MEYSWLSDGNCFNCRRQSYCNKLCKVNKIRTKKGMPNLAINKEGMKNLIEIIGN